MSDKHILIVAHRTAAFPKFVADNTATCAVSAKTTNGGRSMEGCKAGFPFPMPKDLQSK